MISGGKQRKGTIMLALLSLETFFCRHKSGNVMDPRRGRRTCPYMPVIWQAVEGGKVRAQLCYKLG